MLLGVGASDVVEGQATFTTPGSHQWVVPTGVSSVSVVCIGGGSGGTGNPSFEGGAGGALAYGNNIGVTAGSTITIVVGDRGEGYSYTSAGASTFNGASVLSGGGGTVSGVAGVSSGSARTGGGDGGTGNNGYQSGWGYAHGAGGGGCGGYTGSGGDNVNNAAGSSGSGDAAGAGGASSVTTWQAGGGGGSGLFGTQGNDPNNGNARTTPGTGGGKGDRQTGGNGQGNYRVNIYDLHGQLYGGGAGGDSSGNYASTKYGGQGAVRVIWPGDTRTFPSNCADV